MHEVPAQPLRLDDVARGQQRTLRQETSRRPAVLRPTALEIRPVVAERLGEHGDHVDRHQILVAVQLHRARPRSEGDERLDRRRQGRAHRGIGDRCTVQDAVLGADPQPGEVAAETVEVVGDRVHLGVGIRRVVAGERLQQHRTVGRAPRHRPDVVEGVTQRNTAGLRHPSEGGLQPADPAVRRGDPDIPLCRSPARRETARRRRRCRFRSRPAGPGIEVPRIAPDRERLVRIRQADGELHRRGLAHDHRPGGAKPGNHDGVAP